MSTSIERQAIDECISFHGHWCPGLAIGIRAAEYCLRELGHHNDNPLVTVCETDMCGVDAIQFLTGCTLGKGNLIHRDYGKTAFTFYRREPEHGFRLTLAPDAMGGNYDELRELMRLSAQATPAQSERLEVLRGELKDRLLELPLSEIFRVSDPRDVLPRPAKILGSHTCARCGEQVMESRVRLFGGASYCIPCFGQVEQKI